MVNYIKTIILFFPFFFYAQNSKITILDKLDKKPLNGIQIFSGNGSFIGNSNAKGEYEFDATALLQSGIKSIMVYDSNYLPNEYRIDEISAIIYLDKIKSYELEPVVIIKKLSEKYFTVKGYIRSWQLVNNKLVKYGDALIEYQIPYEKQKKNDVSSTVIKKYITAYRTFKTDSIKQKSRIVSVSFNDGYFKYSLPQTDIIERWSKYFKSEQVKDSLYTVFDQGKKVGYAIYDKYNIPSEINISQNFEKEEAVKVLFWKISVEFKEIEKWTGNGETRHPSYLFSSKKALVETKTEGKYNAVETINEIFITDKIIYNDKKPKIYKSNIDKDRSFYNSEYWKEQIKKHPLPSAVTEQLINVNENKNTY
jgi:hypothetical protein